MQKYKYVIGWSQLSPNSGGQIVLYLLCDLLNRLGEKAYMSGGSFPNSLNLNCPIKPQELSLQSEDVIVIYPEVILGNPLNAKNVARWILYKVGVNGGNSQLHGDNDLIFGFKKEYSCDKCIITDSNLIKVFHVMDDIYINQNKNDRSKSCFLIRKGAKWHQSFDQHPGNALNIDTLNHRQIAKVFNDCHTFYSYDPHSTYSKYAALCGCNSIVIPPSNLSSENWVLNDYDRYGIAYGEQDLERARATKHLLMEYIANQKLENVFYAKKFVDLCISHFK